MANNPNPFQRYHYIVYYCNKTEKVYGALQPFRKMFWIREGDIANMEYGWSVKKAIVLSEVWEYKGAVPQEIQIRMKGSSPITFKISHLHTEVSKDIIGSVDGILSLKSDNISI
jgi:hypothetical protein